MFCVERLQWLIQAFLLGAIMGMAALGMGGDSMMLQLAFVVQLAMMVMLAFAALSGICPGRLFLEQFFPSCYKKKSNGDD